MEDAARFTDRANAGRLLGAALWAESLVRPIVLALPRGGVPVAVEVARTLGADLDVLLVRKLGHPLDQELAFGAIGDAGEPIFNEDVARTVRPEAIVHAVEGERAEITRRVE